MSDLAAMVALLVRLHGKARIRAMVDAVEGTDSEPPPPRKPARPRPEALEEVARRLGRMRR